MLKEIQCTSSKDIYDAVDYANSRTDEGRTVINVNPEFAPYMMSKPLHFTKSYGDKAIINMHGLTMVSISENNWKIDIVPTFTGK